MTLLFVHGAGCTGEVFEAQLRAFAHAQAPNLPGHLCAGAPESIGDFADAVNEFVREHGLGHVVLAGHSMGAAIAIETALRKPAWLRGAILIGGGPRMRVAPAFLDGLADDFERTARMIAGYFFAEGSAERVDAALALMRRVGQEQTLRDFRACNDFDALERLEEISVPVLALGGEADKLTPAKHAAALADRVPGAAARIIPGAGHFVMAERPAETNESIAAFLAGLS
ncbi:MAG TPA: alpha/beta hydrolase [Candidatus Baltobacteraceae bacterium]|nr:alpha/beta hydrolase [Candidatus Baltobacteraceae bacterium]